MKRILLTLALAAASFAQAAVINPLPNNIQNGQPADATKLMANFNQIVTNVNANAAALNATNIFTAPQQFGAAITPNQGTIASQVQNDSFVWLGVAGGTANALTANAVISPVAYQAGQRWKIAAALANTGAATININGLGVRTISKFGGSALVAGDIVAGQILVLEDDGIRLQMINTTIPSGIPYADAGGTPNAITVTYLLPAKNLTPVDGLDITVGVPVANTGTPVTLTATFNGITAPTLNVVKFVNNIEVPVAVGDIQGDAWFKFDLPNSVWVLMNPATPTFPVAGSGLLTAHSGVVAASTASALSRFTTITASQTFTPLSTTKTMVAMVVGGGGNGGTGTSGGGSGGGGGATGQVVWGTIQNVTGTYVATVGAGGSPSSFGVITANAGASGASGPSGGAGGATGGAGGAGASAGGAGGASGGAGGASTGNATLGAGGGGGMPGFTGAGGGGVGGAGASGNQGGLPGGAGTANTGAGGGGGGAGNSQYGGGGGAGGAGGSGVIFVWEYQ